MTEKRFKMKKLEYESYFIDSQQVYVDEDEPKLKIDGEKTMSDSQILELLNENEQLKTQVSQLARVNREGDEKNWMIKKRFEFGSPDYRQGAHYSIIDNETNREMLSQEEIMDKLNQLAYEKYILVYENEQLKQRINSRLHFYRELYGSTNDNVVKRVIEDLEDILK